MKFAKSATLLGSALVVATMSAVPAMATLTVTIQDSTMTTPQTVTLTSCPHTGKFSGSTCTGAGGVDAYVIDINDAMFTLSINVATSYSPNGTNGITLNATETAKKAGSLKITLSDIGFTLPKGPSTVVNQGGPTGTNPKPTTGPLSFTGYYDPGNSYCTSFSSCAGTATPTLSYPTYGSTGTSTDTPVNATSPYALDEIIDANYGAAGEGNFGFTLNLLPNVSTPEPASVLLLGGLAGSAILLLRRRRAA